jgi:hypothetical protein
MIGKNIGKYRHEFIIILENGTRVDDSCETLGNNGYGARATMEARYGKNCQSINLQRSEKLD